MVNHFVRSTCVPDALMALDSVADVGDGAMFVFHDNEVVAANAKAIGLYRSLNWGEKVSFDDCFWYGVKTGRTRDTEILKDPADHLAFAKLHRAWSPSHRFCRRHGDTGVIYDRHHIGLNHVWNAQIWLPVCEGGGIDFVITPETKPYEVRRYLARERALSRLLTFLEGSGTALAIVDATGWLLDSTPAMTRLLVRGELLRLGSDERLEGLTEEVTGRIRSCLSEISSGRRSASLVPLPSQDGGNILAGIMRSGPTDPSAIIAVATRDGTAELEALLCDAFRLTPAEAAVAMRMADGATAEGIAEATSRSMPTVRSQLAAVKKKTGSGRQHELAVLVAKAAGLVGGSFNVRNN